MSIVTVGLKPWLDEIHGRPTHLWVMSVPNASTRIRAAVAEWPGISEAPHRFGGVEFRLGTREIGHLHGDHLLDLPFPKKVRDELVAAGLARPHHVMQESGWVSFPIAAEADVDAAIALLRRSHDLIAVQLERRAVQSAAARDGARALARGCNA